MLFIKKKMDKILLSSVAQDLSTLALQHASLPQAVSLALLDWLFRRSVF
jgi:hypothetical protein